MAKNILSEMAAAQGQTGAGSAPIRKDVEADAQAMLEAAKIALGKAQERVSHAAAGSVERRDRYANGCHSIGVNNAYRSLEDDFDALQSAYPAALKRTEKARKLLAGGPFSEEAVLIMVSDLQGAKAVPGFSNHTRGLAIDFQCVQDGQRLGPHKSQREAWRASWLHEWLSRQPWDLPLQSAFHRGVALGSRRRPAGTVGRPRPGGQ